MLEETEYLGQQHIIFGVFFCPLVANKLINATIINTCCKRWKNNMKIYLHSSFYHFHSSLIPCQSPAITHNACLHKAQ